MSRRGDVVPSEATPEQLLEKFGDDAYEVIAMRAFLRRTREAELDREKRRELAAARGEAWTDEDEKLRVGDAFFGWAEGTISGKDVCEAEGLLRSGPSAEGPDRAKGEG